PEVSFNSVHGPRTGYGAAFQGTDVARKEVAVRNAIAIQEYQHLTHGFRCPAVSSGRTPDVLIEHHNPDRRSRTSYQTLRASIVRPVVHDDYLAFPTGR